jgi:hypothetical protein
MEKTLYLNLFNGSTGMEQDENIAAMKMEKLKIEIKTNNR